MMFLVVAALFVGMLWYLGVPVAQLLPFLGGQAEGVSSTAGQGTVTTSAPAAEKEGWHSRITPLPGQAESVSQTPVPVTAEAPVSGEAADEVAARGAELPVAKDVAPKVEPPPQPLRVPEVASQGEGAGIAVVDESSVDVQPATPYVDSENREAASPPATGGEAGEGEVPEAGAAVADEPPSAPRPVAAVEVPVVENRVIAPARPVATEPPVAGRPAVDKTGPAPVAAATPEAAREAPRAPGRGQSAGETVATPAPERRRAESLPVDSAENSLLRQLEITDYLHEADRLYQQGDFRGAIKVLRRITRQYPDSEDARHVEELIGQIKESAGGLVE